MERFYQGHNTPMVIILPESVSDADYVRVKITSESAISADVKLWQKSDMTITDQVLICPITQAESASWPAGKAKVSVHWLFTGQVKEAAEDFEIQICRDSDKAVLGDDAAITLSGIEIDASKIPDPAEVKAAMLRNALVVQAGTVPEATVEAAVEAYLIAHPVEVTKAKIIDALGYTPQSSTAYASDDTDGIIRDTDYMMIESAYENSQAAVDGIVALKENYLQEVTDRETADTALQTALDGKQDDFFSSAESLPTASAETYMQMRVVTVDNTDVLYMCLKKSGEYYWRKIGTSSALSELVLGESELGGE